MPESENPPVNDNHLWLKVVAPETEGNVGKYGFKNIDETHGW